MTDKKFKGYLDRLRENVEVLDEAVATARKMSKPSEYTGTRRRQISPEKERLHDDYVWALASGSRESEEFTSVIDILSEYLDTPSGGTSLRDMKSKKRDIQPTLTRYWS